MDRTIEDVIAEAMDALRRDGTIEVQWYIERYPAMAADLQEVLPHMVDLRMNRALHLTALRTSAYAFSLFPVLTSGVQTGQATVGIVLRSEIERTGLPLEAQAEQMGLPPSSLRQLLDDPTPAEELDNLAIKRLSEKVNAPVVVLVKVLRQVVSLYKATQLSTPQQLAFTRSSEQSSEHEKQTLLDRVRRQDGREDGTPSKGR